MPSRLEAMLDRAEQELHDRYFDADGEADAETTRMERRNNKLERMADDANEWTDFDYGSRSRRDYSR